MKKEYLIGLLTGSLFTLSVVLFLGATNGTYGNGRYQIAQSGSATGHVSRMVDTRTGQRYDWGTLKKQWRAVGKPLHED